VLKRPDLHLDAVGAASFPALAFLKSNDGQSLLLPLEKRTGP
jgi:hypothetical protein